MANIDVAAPAADQQALAAALDAMRPGLTAAKSICAIGDSITADAYSSSGGSSIWTPWGYLTWLRRYLGGRASISGSNVFAVPGKTLAQVRADQLPLALAAKTDICIVHAGINSLDGLPATTAQMIIDYTAIMDGLLANGTSVFLIPIMWKSATASPAFGADLQKQCGSINKFLLDYARSHRGVVISNVNPSMLDFSTGYAQDIYLRDGLHHNQMGAMVAGKVHADRLKPLLIDSDSLFASLGDVYDPAKNPAGNLLANGILAGTSGSKVNGATGNVPTSWRLFRSASGGTVTLAGSKSANSVYPTLEDAIMTIGGTADGVTCILDQEVADANISVGDVVYAECEVDFAFTTGTFGAIGLMVSAKDSGFASLASADDGNMNSSNGRLPEGASGVVTLRTPLMTVPPGYAYRSVALQVLTPPSGACAATVKVRRMSLRKAL